MIYLALLLVFCCLTTPTISVQANATTIGDAVANGDANTAASLIVQAVGNGDSDEITLATANAIVAGNIEVVSEAMTIAVTEEQVDASIFTDAIAAVFGGSKVDIGSLENSLTSNDSAAVASSIAEAIDRRANIISKANTASFLALEQTYFLEYQSVKDAVSSMGIVSSSYEYFTDAIVGSVMMVTTEAVASAAVFTSVEGKGVAAGDVAAIFQAVATTVADALPQINDVSLPGCDQEIAYIFAGNMGAANEANVQAISVSNLPGYYSTVDAVTTTLSEAIAFAYATTVAYVEVLMSNSCGRPMYDGGNSIIAPASAPSGASSITTIQVPDSIGFSVGGASDVENFRRTIQENLLPSPFDVTYEGIFNEYYFDTQSVFDNGSVSCDQLFCPGYSIAISKDPLEENPLYFDFYITVGLESDIPPEDFSRKALNIVIVLDISGSMGDRFIKETNYDPEKIPNQFDSKLDIAKTAIIDMLQLLNINDTLSIVTFSDYAETLMKLTPFEEINLQEVLNKINSIEETGGTNMEAGYQMATKVLKQCSECVQNEKYENRIIFLTDAQPNLGDTTAIGLSSQVTQNAGNQIFTTFIGVGLDFNTQLSEILTKSRGANYFVVGSPEEFHQKLVDEFDFMVTPLVFDLKLEIDAQSFNNGNGWKVIKVYGSPNLEGGLDKEGIFVQINTLFPSPKTHQGAKGGVVLLKMQEPQNSEIPLLLKVSYKDRTALETFESFSEVEIPADQPKTEYFDSTGAQKAVLLARYVELLKGWIVDQHLIAQNLDQNSNIQTQNSASISENSLQNTEKQQLGGSIAVSMDICEYYPADRVTFQENQCQVESFLQPKSQILPMFDSIFDNQTDWEKVQLELSVSKQQGEAMEQFLIYLQDTIDNLEDYSLEQEVGILTKLIDISKQN